MEYRIVKENEFDECADLLANSFLDYIYFKAIWKNDNQRYKVLKVVMKIGIKMFSKQGIQLGAYDGDKLVATTSLLPPNYKSINLFEYIKFGAIKAFVTGGVFNIINYLKMNREANKTIFKMNEPHWFAEALAVANDYKGKGYGSDLIQNGIISYVKEHGGEKIVLITNSEINCNFYKKNGFHIIEDRAIKYKNTIIPNWTLEYDFKK